MLRVERESWIQLSGAIVIGVALALFIHDSGSTFLRVLRIGAREIFLPLFFSIIVAYVLDPWVDYFERNGLRRLYGVLLIYFFLLCGLIFLIYLFFPIFIEQIQEMRVAMPTYFVRLINYVVILQDLIHREFGIFGNIDLTQIISDYFDTHQSDILSLTIETVGGIFSLGILAPLFCFFFLHEGHTLKRAIIARVPNRYFESMLIIFHHLNQSLGSFIRGRFFECLIVGLICQVGFYFSGLKYSWLFAFIAGVTTIVPVFGTLLGMAITCGFVLLDAGDGVLTLLVFGIFLFAHLIDNLFLVPFLVVKSGSLHFMTGIVAIIIGGHVGGVWGMIVAVPVVSICKLITQEFVRNWNTNRAVQPIPKDVMLG